MRYILFFLTVLLFPAPALSADILTGDTRLACEAILCLSTGSPPSECNPSLSKYFSISAKKWKDTLKKRKSFLNMCPTASAQGMPGLVDAIIEGAGRCTAQILNTTLRQTITVSECKPNPHRGSDDPYLICEDKQITVISNKMPSYCRAYVGHGWTYDVGAKYVGDPMKGGRWVD